VEVRTTKITRCIREVGIERLKRLGQVTDLMIPQPVGARPDISDLRHPVLGELMLNAQIPLQYPRHETLRPSSAHHPARVTGIGNRNGRGKARRYQLSR